MRQTLISFNLNVVLGQITRARRTNQSKPPSEAQISPPKLRYTHTHTVSESESDSLAQSIAGPSKTINAAAAKQKKIQKEKKENRKEKSKINEQKLYIKLHSRRHMRKIDFHFQAVDGRKAILLPVVDPKSKQKLFLYLN